MSAILRPRPGSRQGLMLGGATSFDNAIPSYEHGAMVIPSVLAVLRLMTRSNSVGCSTGRSPGLAPLSILSKLFPDKVGGHDRGSREVPPGAREAGDESAPQGIHPVNIPTRPSPNTMRIFLKSVAMRSCE
jgi:hypothetical protein